MGARNIVGAFAVGLALFAFWPFVVGKYQQVSVFREELAIRQLLVEDRQVALDNFMAEYQRFQAQLTGDDADKFAAMVPERRDTAELLSALDSIANGTGMRLTQANIAEERAPRGAQTQVVTLSADLEGRYESFIAFLGQLERNVRLLDVQSVDIGTGSGNTGLQTYKLVARTYFLP